MTAVVNFRFFTTNVGKVRGRSVDVRVVGLELSFRTISFFVVVGDVVVVGT